MSYSRPAVRHFAANRRPGVRTSGIGALSPKQLVDSTGTVLRTDLIPESGQSGYSATYAAGDLPVGDFTVRVSSFLSGSTAWVSSTTTSGAGSKVSVLFVGVTTACT